MIRGAGAGTLVSLRGGGDVVLGRHTGAADLDDPTVSREHARFFSLSHQTYAQDLASTNGTFVNGVRVVGSVRLKDGDTIRLGSHRTLRFSVYDAAEEAAAVELYESSVTDATSGAFNRAWLDERLNVESASAMHHGQALTLLLVDIDNFKWINDQYGHTTGDVVLRVFAANIGRMLKRTESLARFGGDEFVVLCHDTTRRNGLILAERIRAGVERLTLSNSGCEFSITASIGVASIAYGSDASPAALFAAADGAMYRAKRAGRNTVVG